MPGLVALSLMTTSDDARPTFLQRAFDHAATAQAHEGDASRIRLLEAARDEFSRIGVARTTLDDIAKLANLSRVTIYRKFRTKDELVDAVIFREFQSYLDDFGAQMSRGHSAADRLVIGFVSSIRTFATNPLIGYLLANEPAILVDSITEGGNMLAAISQFVAHQLRVERNAGNIADSIDVELTAEILVRLSASFLTAPSQLIDTTDEKHLETIARTYLVPMLGPAPDRH